MAATGSAMDRRIFADRKAHRELVIMLATEIYRRERGAPPPSEEALVGTYLKSLPDDGSAELPMGRRRQSSSGFGRLGSSEPR